MSAATSVVPKKKISVFAPTRPSDRMSPSDATPTKTLATTSGTTTIVISRMNTVPTGSRYDTATANEAIPGARATSPTTHAGAEARAGSSARVSRRDGPLGP